MMKKIAAIKKFIRLPLYVKTMFFEAVFLSLKFRFLTSFLPFRIWIKTIDKKSLPQSAIAIEDLLIKNVFRAVRRSSLYLPFKEKCLIESLVMKKMLQRRNINVQMSFGLSRNGNKELIAHAWTSYKGKTLTGGKNAMNFVEIKQF